MDVHPRKQDDNTEVPAIVFTRESLPALLPKSPFDTMTAKAILQSSAEVQNEQMIWILGALLFWMRVDLARRLSVLTTVNATRDKAASKGQCVATEVEQWHRPNAVLDSSALKPTFPAKKAVSRTPTALPAKNAMRKLKLSVVWMQKHGIGLPGWRILRPR